MILAKSLEKSGFRNQVGAGVVFTGGMTKLEGLRDLAVSKYSIICRLGLQNQKTCMALSKTLKDPSVLICNRSYFVCGR